MTTTATRTRTRRPASRRGVLIYAVGVLVLVHARRAGHGVVATTRRPAPAPSCSSLSPLLLAVGLRTIGREGWADAGLRLGRERGWYAVRAAAVPRAVRGRRSSLGALTGDVHLAPGAGRAVRGAVRDRPRRPPDCSPPSRSSAGAGTWSPGSRRSASRRCGGTSPSASCGPSGTCRTSSRSATATPTLPLAAQIPLFTVAVLAMAVIWGVVRDRTGSVWPAVLGHGMANAVAFPLLAADVVVIDSPLVHAARPEGLVVLSLLVLTAVVVYRRWGADRYCPAAWTTTTRQFPWATMLGWSALVLARSGPSASSSPASPRSRRPQPAVLRHPRAPSSSCCSRRSRPRQRCSSPWCRRADGWAPRGRTRTTVALAALAPIGLAVVLVVGSLVG